jgi:hypothetical protein
MKAIRFGSWKANLDKHSGARGTSKHVFIERLMADHVDVLALQEVLTYGVGPGGAGEGGRFVAAGSKHRGQLAGGDRLGRGGGVEPLRSHRPLRGLDLLLIVITAMWERVLRWP